MQQLAFVDQHEAHGFTGLDVQGLGLKGNVPQRDFNGARGFIRRGRLAERVGVSRICQGIETQRQQAACQ